MELPTTRSTLLGRLTDPADSQAWRTFEADYRPLIMVFCRNRGVVEADAEDVAQNVMMSMARSMQDFAYDPNRGRFRNYLFRCVRNALVDWARRASHRGRSLDTTLSAALSAGDEGGQGELAEWEKEWMAFHYHRALQTVRKTVEPRSAELFDQLIKGASVAALAAEFNMTEDAVVKVRQRIRTRMEEVVAQQIKEEDELE